MASAKKRKGAAVDIEQLREQIRRQAQHIRVLKKTQVGNTDVVEEVFQLLCLKLQYCLNSPVPVTQHDLVVATTVWSLVARWTALILTHIIIINTTIGSSPVGVSSCDGKL
jgi:hypothetical protein